MTEVNEDAQTVHLANHLLTKGTDTVMRVVTTSRIADIVVAIMA